MFYSSGFNFGAPVICSSANDGLVYGQRVWKKGLNPAPACVNVPYQSKKQALEVFKSVLKSGFSAILRNSKRTQGKYELKIFLPENWRTANIRYLLSHN